MPKTNIPSAAAPSAVAPTDPTKLDFYDHLASQSILAASEPAAPSAPAADPNSAAPSAPAPIPSPEPALATPAPVADPAAVQTPEPAAPVAATDEDVPEPTPEELAVLNDAGQRALKAERQARKAAKAETRELQAKLAELEAKLSAPPPAPTEPPPAAPAPTATPTATAPSAATPALADCTTFEQVDARHALAVQTEQQVTELQALLTDEGPQAVAAKLGELGVAKIGNAPIAEATEKQVTDFLRSALYGAKLTQTQIGTRKQFLATAQASWQAASQVLPEINQVGSATHKAIAQLVAQNPVLKTFPNWPQIAVKLYLGERVFNQAAPTPTTQTTTAPAKPAAIRPAPATVPAPSAAPARQAPGPSAVSAVALPKSNRLEELSAKLANGTATNADVDEYGKLSVSV